MALGEAPAGSPSFLVYGPYGAGVSTALKAFRDYHYRTLAGLSLASLDRFLLLAQSETEPTPVALSPEINPFTTSEAEVSDVFEALKGHNPDLKVLYLSTPVETLIQRYAALDKKHPYEQPAGLKATIEQEAAFYKALKGLSDYHIDTSTTSAKELGLKVGRLIGADIGVQPMTLQLTSFGFKHGVPTDAEMVFDMRFLPNPFYDPELRPHTGLDQAVSDYVFSFPETQVYLDHWQALLAHSLPLYQRQGKTRLKVAIGCTGGQHRSVAMTMALSAFLQKTFPDFQIQVVHREQHHWPQPLSTPQV